MANITLTRGQVLANEPNYRVHVTGTYVDNALVEVYHVDDDAVPVCCYNAFYIKYGHEQDVPANNGIFKINMSTEHPKMLDYDILGLHKKRTIIKGELKNVKYYTNYDGIDYSDLVLEENITYTRNESGLVMYRNMSICWYLTDNTIGCDKNTVKYYSMIESIDEGIVRRNNMIAAAKLIVLGAVGLANGQDLLTELNTQINLFVNGNTQPLRDAVTASTKPYLNSTIKAVIVEELTF